MKSFTPLLSTFFTFNLLFSTPILASNLLFMTNQGRHEEAARELRSQLKIDETLVEEMALALLSKGVQSNDPEVAILALFGASVSMNEKAEALIEQAYHSSHPQIQLAALSMLARSKSESSLFVLNQAIGASHPLIRLEAAYLLAERRAPQASIKIESLMQKMPEEVHFLFPRLFALIGDEMSTKTLRRLLSHSDEKVRVEAILAIGKAGRDDLSRDIRRNLSHPDALSKEAASVAIGQLRDESAVPLLIKLSKSGTTSVKIAALKSLKIFNYEESLEALEKFALDGNLFAISILAAYPEAKPTLRRLMSHTDKSVRANTTLALLTLRDPKAAEGLSDLLIKDRRDICYVPVATPAGGLTAFKAVPSAKQNLSEGPTHFELSLQLREEALQRALELDNETFYPIARMILNEGQNDLVPLLMTLLENKGTDSIDFLKEEEQRAGAPYIRAYAALTLFRMRENGHYEKKLKNWIKSESTLDLVKFRPFIPWELRQGNSFELTPNEKASLWISILEAFIGEDPDKAIDLLLEMIGANAGKNRFVFAGLLLRSIQ